MASTRRIRSALMCSARGATFVGPLLATLVFAACSDSPMGPESTGPKGSPTDRSLLAPSAKASAAWTGLRQLSGHLTPKIESAPVVGPVEPSKELNLTLGLEVKDRAGLKAAMEDVSSPRSPSYRKYLTPEGFADRYGATAADYQKLLDWAASNRLKVTTHRNRLAAEASGAVADIESAFHVRMQYRLRPDGSQFYAPDTEPSLDAGVPLEHVGSLDDYVLPRRAGDQGGGGSGPSGARTGADFRNAYAPGYTRAGAGQSIGIVMIASDGFYPIDVTNYFTYTSINTFPQPLPVIVEGPPITGVTSGEGDADVQMALSMAPEAQVYAFTGVTEDAILQDMADYPQVKQLSSSIGWVWDSIGLTAMTQFALQGQSFFESSGDAPWGATLGCYFNGSQSPKADYLLPIPLTIVGGSALNMTGTPPATAYGTEDPWWVSSTEGGFGGPECFTDGGGIPIPFYQLGLSNTANQGSNTYRNAPDVAAEAAYVFIYINYNGVSTPSGFVGTSVSAPLWAGFMALVNQWADIAGYDPVGFANPALYDLASSPSSYALNFNDIVGATGGSDYAAVAGYDLVTGLGSPTTALIGDLAEFSGRAVGLPTILEWNGSAFVASGYSFCASSISVAPAAFGIKNGDPWATGCGTNADGNTGVWRMQTGGVWNKMESDVAVQVAVSPTGAAWAINVSDDIQAGNILYWDTTTNAFVPNPTGGCGLSISVGPDSFGLTNGTPWVTGCDTNPDGNHGVWQMQTGGAWKKMEADVAVQIAVSPTGSAWAINAAGDILYWDSTKEAFVLNPTGGCATSIGVGPDAFGLTNGTPWVTGCDTNPDGNHGVWQMQTGGAWKKMEADVAVQIAVSPGGTPWATTTGN
jgi:hypothetical protein